jgi:tricorn protease
MFRSRRRSTDGLLTFALLAAAVTLVPAGLAGQQAAGATAWVAPDVEGAVPGTTVIDHTVPLTLEGPEEGLGFYRDPTLRGDVLVFQAEGDLWSVSVAGGRARRLTTHPGLESHPHLSPDGATLAFTARYEGPPEVYTMPARGGPPVRRTWEAEMSLATAWTPAGELVYTTNRFATLPRPQLVSLDRASGDPRLVPLAEASEGAWSDDGRVLFFVRPAFHNNVTKRYTGGTARDVWRFDLAGGTEAVELTGDWEGESHSPMWWNDRVYFVSDRDGTMNLWSMTAEGGDMRQHTRHAGMDLRDPALDAGRIVYNVGADLWLYDIAQGTTGRIAITLASDFDQLRERWVDDPMDYLTQVNLHPKGESVVLTARGRVFVAPAKSGRLVRVSADEGVRYRDAVFSPDGARVIALSDATGELEFVDLPADGVGEARTLTRGGTILRFQAEPSPDGRWIAFTDNNQDLWVMPAEGGEGPGGGGRLVSSGREGSGDPSWSPDGRWLAFGETAPNSFRQLKIFDTATGNAIPLTSDRTNSGSPAWSADGRYLFFLSDRNLRSAVTSPWGSRAPEPFFPAADELYVIALRADGESPFRPRHELMPAAPPTAAGDRASGDSGSAPPEVSIDVDGLQARVWRVPVEAGSYGSLVASTDALFWVARATSGPARLMALAIDPDDPEPVEVASGVGNVRISLDRRHLLVRQGANLSVIPARAARAELADARVDLSGWTFSLDPREDWRQLYLDAWRLERDYFYDPGMHGVDWEEVRDRYLPLVDRVTTRDELSDVIGQVVGELSALHTSVRGGDLRAGPDDVSVASLGARLTRDVEAGGYRIEHVYRHDPDYPEERSPLADPALGIDEGDVIVAVNGRATLEAPALGSLLRNQAGRQVRLEVRPAGGGERFEAIALPIGSEFGLRYTDWEVSRRERAEERSEGQVGYVHLRAMGGNDVTQWFRQFYPVFDRPGLIIDVRGNNGGNIDSFLLARLIREAWMYWKGRVGQPTWNMQYAPRGHMVVLVDQETASDGEAFAEGFRRLGLGPVVGMRTWGGEIWLSSVNTLSDGGLARAPMTGVYGPEGEWLIEQIGVIPDVVVDNLPHATFNGDDAQLDAAVDHLLRRIAEEPVAVPAPPAYPDRGFRYPGRSGG